MSLHAWETESPGQVHPHQHTMDAWKSDVRLFWPAIRRSLLNDRVNWCACSCVIASGMQTSMTQPRKLEGPRSSGDERLWQLKKK